MNANLFSRKIEMTKTEAKAAGKPNTTEYNTLLELMKNFPGFQIEIVKSAAKKVDRFKGLDINYMENYIKSHKPELLETFYELRGLDANGKPKDTRTLEQRGAIITLLIELKRKFPNAMIRGHNEMPGSVPKACPCYCPSKEYAYLMK